MLPIGAQYRSTGVIGPSGTSSQMQGNFVEQSSVCQCRSLVRTTQSFFSFLAFGCPGAHALNGRQLSGSPEKRHVESFFGRDGFVLPVRPTCQCDKIVFEKQADKSFSERGGPIGQGRRYQCGQKRRARVRHDVGQMTAAVFARDHGVRIVQTVGDHFENADAGGTREIFVGYRTIKWHLTERPVKFPSTRFIRLIV